MRAVFLAVCLLVSTTSIAVSESKTELASRFYDATTAKQVDGMVSKAAAAILQQDPRKVRQAEIYKQWAKESFGSPEYKKIYVTYYTDNFSFEELKAMNEWASNPLFVGYMTKVQMFVQWSAPRFQEFLRAKNPELARRLSAEGFAPSE